MPNIGVVLKDEIRRLAKKEARAAVAPLQKKVMRLTRSNAALRRIVPQLEKTVARLEQEAKARQLEGVRAGEKRVEGVRIGPRSIGAQRKRLKLTREEFGKLAGVTANAIYLWESGQVSPSEKSRAVLVGLRKLRAREAKRLLESARQNEKAKRTPGRTARKPRRRRRKK